ncbi:MAG: N-acetylglucosamine-specific PTS transporter subunit IIBC [Bacilli bacterium]
MLNFLQRIGRALLIPIAVLPAAALFLRLGFTDMLGSVEALKNYAPYIMAVGDVVFANLALLFAIGVAVGLAKDQNGAAGLAGAVSYLTLVQLTSMFWNNPSIKMQAFGGILAGILAGLTYNKFYQTKLPDWLGFFSGRRLVPIMASFFTLLISIPIMWVWPTLQSWIEAGGEGIVGLGAVGAGLFGVFNRLLLPFGLHHVLNTYFFQTLGEFEGKFGDLNRFFAGDPTAGTYMAGFYPVMMFGLPAVALAIYFAAKPQNRKLVASMLVSVAFTSFLTGITEPIEFMFMFLSPVLLVAHAVLTGLSMFLASALGALHGFGFSAGLIDYLLNFGIATKPVLLLGIGLVVGAVYFFTFLFVIKKFNLPTPGREEDFSFDGENAPATIATDASGANFIEALGGVANIKELDHCATRLRLTVEDAALVNEAELKKLGARGVVKMNKTTVQVIIGTNVQFVCEDIKNNM